MSRKRFLWIAVFVVAVGVACALIFTTPKKTAQAAAPKAASVVRVTRGPLSSSLTIAGQFEPYQQVDLHAKVSGYIRWIKVDIGDRVHQGQVLATLEVPELQDQLQGAEAQVRHTQSEIVRSQSEVTQAESNYSALHAEYTRLNEAARQKPGLIAEQELDDARAKDEAAQAQVGVAKASLAAMQEQLGVSQADSHRMKTMAGYEQIISPFNGVVTMRYADTGSLIQAGTSSNTQSMPVVQVAQSDLLRLRMPVPETDVPYISQGSDVQVKVSATGKSFTGKIVRFTRALDPNTRTMLSEVDVPNRDLTLSPGMYASSTIELQHKADTLVLPSQAVVQNGTQADVLVVDGSGKVEKRNVTMGIQSSNRIEITGGLKEGEQVIASGQTNYQPGDVVAPHPAFIPTEADEVGQ